MSHAQSKSSTPRSPHLKRALAWSVVASLAYALLGFAACVAMERASFDVQSWILTLIGVAFVAAAVILLRMPLRLLLPLYVLPPFALFIFANYCGDMGRTHYFDSVPFAFGSFFFIGTLFINTILKLARLLQIAPSIVFAIAAILACAGVVASLAI